MKLYVIGACAVLAFHVATTFLEGGGSVEVLQDLMDHEDITTTMIYSHMTDKRKREQKEKAFAKHPPQPLTD